MDDTCATRWRGFPQQPVAQIQRLPLARYMSIRRTSLFSFGRGMKGPVRGDVQNTIAVSYGKIVMIALNHNLSLTYCNRVHASMPLTCCALSQRRRWSSSHSDSTRSRHPGPPSISAMVILLSTPKLLLLFVPGCIDDAGVPLVGEELLSHFSSFGRLLPSLSAADDVDDGAVPPCP